MSSLLLELYSEEMNFKFFEKLENDAINIFFDYFEKINIFIKKEFIKIYLTPCRIIIKIDSIKKQKDTKNKLEKNIPEILKEISNTFTRPIKWGECNKNNKWLAPLKNILCLLDDDIVKFNFCNIKSGNATFGHKIMLGNEKNIEIKNYNDYLLKMKESFVIFNQKERKEIIKNNISKIEKENKLQFIDHEDDDKENILINEIIYTTEYPTMFLGEFKKEFLSLPVKILSSEIANNYKSLPLSSGDKISNKIIIFTNIKTNDNGKNIIKTKSNAINNRLEYINLELENFVNEDFNKKIEKLKNISYYQGFGSIYDKIERLVELSRFLSLWMPRTNIIDVEQAARIVKINYTTNFAGNNKKLNDYLPSYYAQKNNFPKSICDGLEERNKPTQSTDGIPKTNVGKILSLANAIDYTSSMFIINTENENYNLNCPLNKKIMSAIRVMVEGNMNISLNLLIHKSLSLFKTKLYKINNKTKTNIKNKINSISYQIEEAFLNEFIKYLETNNCDKNLALSIIKLSRNEKKNNLNLNLLYTKILQIDEYTKENKNNFLNIVKVHKKLKIKLKDLKLDKKNAFIKKIINNRAIIHKQDKIVNKKIKIIQKNIKTFEKNKDYKEYLNELSILAKISIEILKNKEQSKNLHLLYKINIIFLKFLDFSNISL